MSTAKELKPIASRRSATDTIPATTTAVTTSARCGVRNRGCTASSHPGSSRRRAIDSAVRLTPASNDKSTPAAATAAPARTTDSRPGHRPAPTASASGAADVARASGPTASSAAPRTRPYTTTTTPSARGIARGMVTSGSTTSSPRVANRA